MNIRSLERQVRDVVYLNNAEKLKVAIEAFIAESKKIPQTIKQYPNLKRVLKISSLHDCLLEAIEKGYNDCVKVLIESGVTDINNRDAHHFYATSLTTGGYVCYNDTPLTVAIKKGNLDCVKMLLEHKANPNIPDYDNHSPLTIVTSTQRVFLTKNEKNKFDINSYSVDDDLFEIPGKFKKPQKPEAPISVKVAMLKCLLEAKANCNSHDESGYTPLMNAAESSNEAALKLLLENKADINVKSNWPMRQTALSIAVEKEVSNKCIELLMDAEIVYKSGRPMTKLLNRFFKSNKQEAMTGPQDILIESKTLDNSIEKLRSNAI